MRVCIVGSGWYGCHVATYLLERGHSVTLVDKEPELFSGASSHNQNRLHLGFHYPRSKPTIDECQRGFSKFCERYGECVVSFQHNNYLIHDSSRVEFKDYLTLFSDYQLVSPDIPTRDVVPVCIRVKEAYIDFRKAKQQFDHLLPRLETRKVATLEVGDHSATLDGVSYDYVINCTNNQWVPLSLPFVPLYENVCSFVYHIPFETITAYTVMDGSFFSIYPYDLDKSLYTITHVTLSVLTRSGHLVDREFDVDSVRYLVEKEVHAVLPSLELTYHSYFVSKKTKYDVETDDRSLRVFHKGRYLSFSGGKITGIFETESILDEILTEQTSRLTQESPL